MDQTALNVASAVHVFSDVTNTTGHVHCVLLLYSPRTRCELGVNVCEDNALDYALWWNGRVRETGGVAYKHRCHVDIRWATIVCILY